MKSTSTKDRILDVATDLFSRQGFSAVSIRDITRAVGIKESSLYNHFTSKDAILAEILGRFRQEFAGMFVPFEQMEALLPSVEPEQFLQGGIMRFKAYLDRPHTEQLWRIVSMEQFREPAARAIISEQMIDESLALVERIFAWYIAHGKIRPIDPRVLATEYQYPIFAMLTHYAMLRFDGRDTTDLERRMEEHIVFFLNAIRS